MRLASRLLPLSMLPGLLAVALVTGCSRNGESPAQVPGGGIERRPRSVLLLTLDTTRADHLEPYGARDVSTPNLARLAGQGVVFEHAYAVAPVTLPTHATLLTGLYPPEHGVRHNGIHVLAGGVPTLTEALAAAGYRTAAFISAAVLERRYGLDRGFEIYDDDLSAGGPKELRSMTERPAAATVEAALAWLEGLAAEERFFLWVHLFEPHAPYAPPEPFAESYRDRPYDGEIAAMDGAIGRLLSHPRLEPEQEVVTVAVGDHGEGLGEHGEKTHGMLIYDATLRIPWILRLPGGPRGLRIETPVSQVDLTPTLLDLLGLEPLPAAREMPKGRSLLPLLGGARETAARPLYAETHVPFHSYGWAKLRSVRRGDLKYIAAPSPELYDLERDPSELDNLFPRRRDEGQRLADEMAAFGPETPEAGPTLPRDREAEARLRGLGYLAGGGARPEAAPRPDPKAVIDLHEALQRIGVLLQTHRFGEAVPELRRVLTRDPENSTALQDLARALAELGRADDAALTLRHALDLDPGSATLHLALADVEARRGNPRRALELSQAAMALEPQLEEAQIETARFLAAVGRGEEAAELLDRALAASSNNPWVEVRHAELVEIPRGELAAAEARLRRAVERDPYLADAWSLLGEVLERTGRPRDAVAVYRSALERQPRELELTARLGRLLANTGDPAAEEVLRRALELAPTPRPDLHLSLGDHLAARGRAAEARQQWQRAAESESTRPEALNDRARALVRLARPAEAEAVWRALIRDHPGFAPAHDSLAALAIQRRDWRDAEAWAQRAVELDPHAASAWNNLAIALEEQGRATDAEAAYRRSAEADPTYWRASYNLGLLLARTGRFREAAEAFEGVLARLPDHAASHYELGLLAAGPLADREAARRHLEAALEADPDHPRSARIRELLRQW